MLISTLAQPPLKTWLAPAEIVTVDGYVTNVNTNWPLYAKITIDGSPGDPIWTNPVTGYYHIDLVSGQTYTFHVELGWLVICLTAKACW